MAPRPLIFLALATFWAASAGCKPTPPAAPPAPTADLSPPPPPKCESLAERCASAPDTKAKIPNVDVFFTPAGGWLYAQQSSATIAQSGDQGPAIAFLGFDFDAKDQRKEGATKDATLAELVKQLGLSPLKRKVSWRKPDDKKKLGGLEMGFWQLEEAGTRGPKKGPLLVVAGHVAEGKGVIGVGFVPDDDKSKADEAIMKSIESIGKAQ